MMIKVQVFAMLKEMLGGDEVCVDLPGKVSCRQVLEELSDRGMDIASVLEHSLVAVNGRYADAETSLQANDEMAILPPVSGG